MRSLPFILALTACGGAGGGPTGPVGTRLGPALGAMLAGADHVQAPWRCAAADLPEIPAATLTIGARTWQLGGHALRVGGDGPLSIGVIADAGGAAPSTLAALGRLQVRLDVDLVIVLGGMGATRAELEATLGAIGASGRPIVVLPGDLEQVRDHVATLAALQQRGIHVLDGRLVRWIELPGATIGTLPGAVDPARLVGGAGGCTLASPDVEAVVAELATRPGLRIVASAEAPRHDQRGDLAFSPALGRLDVQLFGADDVVSPRRDGKRDGRAIPLAPGTSDATTRLSARRAPSAGILTVRADTWTWTPVIDSP
ncbi:MAG: hypothetical protein NT062_24315 [Proteobacteria bacterium]|nr:hypothetical protein [Pseudomonadota bacterium]